MHAGNVKDFLETGFHIETWGDLGMVDKDKRILASLSPVLILTGELPIPKFFILSETR